MHGQIQLRQEMPQALISIAVGVPGAATKWANCLSALIDTHKAQRHHFDARLYQPPRLQQLRRWAIELADARRLAGDIEGIASLGRTDHLHCLGGELVDGSYTFVGIEPALQTVKRAKQFAAISESLLRDFPR